MTEKPTPEIAAQLLAALCGEAPAIICPTRCEPRMYGEHHDPPAPHPWAGPEDVAHAAATGQPEPTGNCGCNCAREATAEEQLRARVRAALKAAGLSQAEACRQLGCSTKHMNMMLTGKSTLTLTWAEGILGLCGHSLVIDIRPDDPKERP